MTPYDSKWLLRFTARSFKARAAGTAAQKLVIVNVLIFFDVDVEVDVDLDRPPSSWH